MKILKKIYNKLFINYKYLSSLFDKQTDILNKHLSVIEVQTSLLNKQNEIISSRTKDLGYKIDAINDNLLMLKDEINKLHSKIEEHNYVNYELNTLNLIRESDKIKLLLVGFYGAYNVGDDLMLKGILKNLDPDKFDITIMMSRNSNIKIEDLNHVNCIYYPKKGNDFYHLAQKFDKVIFGGGAIIDDSKYDTGNSFQFDLGTIFVYLCTEFIYQGKEVYAVGLSSVACLTNNKYIKGLANIVEKAKYFSVRDDKSMHYLRKLLNTKKVKFSPDLVFSLDFKKKVTSKIKTKKIKKIGIIWICTDETKESLISLLKSLKEYEIHLIPFYNYLNNDKSFFETIVNKEQDLIIEDFTNNIDEIYNIYDKCDFIISMRYHGILLGYMFGKPTLAINYDVHTHYFNKISYIVHLFSKNYVNYSNLSNINVKQYIACKNSFDNKIIKEQQKILEEEIKIIKEKLERK